MSSVAVEIWNLVFMAQFDRTVYTKQKPLLTQLPKPIPSIPAWGLERIACVLQGVLSNLRWTFSRR